VGSGGVVGGIIGAITGLGIPEYEAKRYEGRIREGGILLSVHSDNSDWTKKAKEILERTGAQDISSAGEASADFDKSDRPMPRGTGRTGKGMATTAGMDFDSDYRRDFDARYATLGYQYDEYEPAYQFGATCASDARYQNRDWSAIEPEVRRDWESRGKGTWEGFKDSIRYGWDRVRGRRAA
jgi:hypothetical protein